MEGGAREMDEELLEFAREAFEGDEIDMDYELMRQRFYDFTRPESYWEAEEAEEWFRFAGGYHPTPFLEKLLNWQKENHPVPVKTSAESKDVEVTRCSTLKNCMETEISAFVDDNDKEFSNHMAQDTLKTKLKSSGKSPHLLRSSTLMKFTASQLAKQNQHREVHSNRLLRRVAKKLEKLDEKSQNSPPPTMGCENSKQCSIALCKFGSAITRAFLLLTNPSQFFGHWKNKCVNNTILQITQPKL
ncbi:hypothetical protein FF2_001761 [Malus domestica]